MRALRQSHDCVVLLVLQMSGQKVKETECLLCAHIVQTDRATPVALGIAPLFEGGTWQCIDNVIWGVSWSHFTDGRGQRQQVLIGRVKVLIALWESQISE